MSFWTTLGKIFKNRKQIFEGVKNNIWKKDDIEKVALWRMEICSKCPLIDKTGDKCALPGTQPCCSECGCKLAYKTRSLSSECPHPKGPRWKAEISPEEQDKLYFDLNYDPDKDEPNS